MTRRGIKLNGTHVAASIMATLTGAVAASYLGVGGTLVGAAVGSLASTAGTEVYRHYLHRSQERLRGAAMVRRYRSAARSVAGRGAAAQTGPRDPVRAAGRREGWRPDAPTEVFAARQPAGPDPARAGLSEAPTEDFPVTGGGRRVSRGRWLALAGASLSAFLVVIVAITVFEAVTGKPLDASVWHRPGTGTSVGGVVHPRSSRAGSGQQNPASPAPAASTAAPATGTPATPTPAPTPSATAPATTAPAGPAAGGGG